jgi:hypothetical protein
MNIIEAILRKNNKYIILVSGYLWWKAMDDIVDALAENLSFEVLKINQLLPYNKLVTSADHINFEPINELMKEKLEYNKTKGLSKGYIISSYTFPMERLDFYPDFHININVNPTLLTNITVDLMKSRNIPRIDVDSHISYLSKSWKTNKINKFVIFSQNYLEPKIQNDLYALIFDSIMDNIMKKLYGEKYDEYKNANLINTNPNKQLINVSDNDKLSVKDIQNINQGIKNAEFIDELDDIIIKSDNDTTDDDEDEDEDEDEETETESNSDTKSAANTDTISEVKAELKSVVETETETATKTETSRTSILSPALAKGGFINKVSYIGRRRLNNIINI